MDLRLCMFEELRRGLMAKQYDFDSDMDLRLYMFRRRGYMDLRVCIFEGRRRFESDMDLRVCMSQRLQSHGLACMCV